MASLLFDANGEYVSCGSATTLDDVPNPGAAQNIFMCTWVYLDSTAAAAGIYQKSTSCFFKVDNSTRYRAALASSGTSAQVLVPFSSLASHGTGKWIFLAVGLGWDTTIDACRMWCGDLVTAPTEASSYSLQNRGTGSYSTDAASDALLGSLTTSVSPLNGRMAFFGLWAMGSVSPTINHVMQVWQRPVIPSWGTCKLFLWPGRFADASSTQPDWSGNKHNGTVTNATLAAGVPVGMLHRPARKAYGGLVSAPTAEVRVKSLTLLGTG